MSFENKMGKSGVRSQAFWLKSGLALGLLSVVATGCVAPKESAKKEQPKSKTVVTVPSVKHDKVALINEVTKFSSKVFGVEGSPRVSSEKRTRKGGGRFQIGNPYKIRGKWYTPREDKNLNEVGLASWYGPNFHGRLTANGEIYDQYGISAAHPTMPLPSYAKVTNLENGRVIQVRVNDRGPYSKGRVIDLSARAAELLGYTQKGVAKVRVEYVGRARMDGLDEKILLATYQGPGGPILDGTDSLGSGTMIAMAEPVQAIGAVSAINQSFEPAANTLSGGVPIPTVRPTLFEGVPLASTNIGSTSDNVSQRLVYKPAVSVDSVLDRVPRPLAFADETADKNDLFYSYSVPRNFVESPFADNQVIIRIGTLSDQATERMLQRLTTEAGEIYSSSGSTFLRTSERHANQVLDYLLEIGLKEAKIL